MQTKVFYAAGIVIMLFLGVGLLPAQSIDNSTVEIIDFFPAYNGYDVENAMDTDEDSGSSPTMRRRAEGTETYIAFDFGQPYEFTQIIFTDRVTSGGGNIPGSADMHDSNWAFNYTFSMDDDFTNGNGMTDDIVIEVEPENAHRQSGSRGHAWELQTVTDVPDITAQYLLWQVIETDGANPGANDFEFIAGAGGQSLQPGDADRDYDFDQLDLVQVQIANKYLTGAAATWGEGDWDGGPGGSPDSPPVGDGLFNQLDIIAALNAGKYLTGPYRALVRGR